MWKDKLREDFQEFADSIIWSNDDGSEKYIGVGNMADWIVTRMEEREEEIRKECLGIVKCEKCYKAIQCSFPARRNTD